MIFICTRYVYIINYIVIKFNWRKSVNMHNNFYHKGKKILFTSMAVAALSVIAANPVAAKAAESQGEQTSKAPEVNSGVNAGENDSLGTSKWTKDNCSYDEKTKTLTIKAGTIDNDYKFSEDNPINPAQIAWNIDGVDTDQIQTIKIDGAVTFKGDASSLFAGLPNLEKIEGLKNLDTKEVTNMKQMFASDPKLTSLDLSNFVTSSVTDMMGMFMDDSSLTSLDVSHFNTEKVTDMSYMFAQSDAFDSNDLDLTHNPDNTDPNMNPDNEPDPTPNSKLTEVKGLDHFDTKNVKRMWDMFKNERGLTHLDISHFIMVSNDETITTDNTTDKTAVEDPGTTSERADNPYAIEKGMLSGLDSLTSLKLGKDNIIKSSGLNTKGTWNLNGKNLTSEELVNKFDGKNDVTDYVGEYTTTKPVDNTNTPSTPSNPSTPVTPSTPSTPVVPSNNVTPKPNTNVKKGVKRIVTHNAYIFNQNGVRVSGEFYVGDSITTYGTKYINGKKFYDLGNDRFVKANNVTGINRKLKHNAYIYTKKNNKVKRFGRKVLKKNRKVRTYGGAVKMHNKWYYIIGKNQFVKKANFR